MNDGAKQPPKARGMAVPEGRVMPREERLVPPVWKGGRCGPPNGDEFNVIGKRNRKVDGLAKLTGRAVYTDDLALPRMLHGKLLRSIHAHARILSIDASAALALPGVHAVVTGRDMPEYFGIIPWTQDEQALCTDKVRYVGDAVAAVGGRRRRDGSRATPGSRRSGSSQASQRPLRKAEETRQPAPGFTLPDEPNRPQSSLTCGPHRP